jgi:hypothetical protein
MGLAFLITVVVSGMSANEQKSVKRSHKTAQITNIAAKFDCSCGQCDKTLKNCDCPTAKDTFAYIGQQLEKDIYSRLEIIRMVDDRFGFLKNKSILNG